MRFEDTVEITAPPERVWALTEDVEAWPSFSPTMTRIERLDAGPLGVGSRARIKQPAQRSAVWTVTRFEPGRAFAWQTRALAMTMVGTHEIAPSSTGCVNRLVLELSGPTARVLGTVLGPVLRSSLRRENAAFKLRAEQ
jgi:hypothetical protein